MAPNEPCVDSSSPPIRAIRSRNFVKQAYIGGRNDVHGAPPGIAARRHPIPTRSTNEPKRLRSQTMRPFSYDTAAELFPAAIRKKKRAGFAYRRFGTAAEAVRFAIEELPADSLNGAYLQVEEARFDQSGIRTLYESEAFLLQRRPRAPAPSDADADAA